MSYYFAMSFASVPNKAAVFSLCQRAANRLCERLAAQEHIRNMYPFFQQRCLLEHVEPTSFMREMWIQNIFQLRFVYWAQHNLLALCGADYPGDVMSLFGPVVGFQNGTDQDYPLNDWDLKIRIFRTIIDGVSTADKESIESILGFDCDDEGYARRSAVYAAIFGTLDLSNWLYGRDGRFERIRMSGLTSQERILDIYRWGSVIYQEN